MLLMTVLYTSLRIADILRIRVEDIKKNYITIREKKTSKLRRIYLNHDLKKALNSYIHDKEPYEFLIRSREGVNKPISRARAYDILRDAAQEVGIDSVGTHSLRKTFGYWAYKDSNPEETLRYIGIEQDNVDLLIKNAYRNARH